MVLLVDLNLLFQLLSLGQSEQLSPMGEDLHSVEMGHFLLLYHLFFELLLPLLEDLLLFLDVIEAFIDVLDSDHDSLLFGARGSAFY